MALENLHENEDVSARYKADIANNEALRKELQVNLNFEGGESVAYCLNSAHLREKVGEYPFL